MKNKCDKCGKPEFYPDRALTFSEDENEDLHLLCGECLPEDWEPDTLLVGFERGELRHRMETYKRMK